MIEVKNDQNALNNHRNLRQQFRLCLRGYGARFMVRPGISWQKDRLGIAFQSKCPHRRSQDPPTEFQGDGHQP